MPELPALKKVYCYKCNKWLKNISLDDDFPIYEHNHEWSKDDWCLQVVGERRLDN